MASRVRRFLKGVAHEFNPKEPFIKKSDYRNVNNLWTGREIGGKGKIAVGVGALGYGGYQVNSAPYQQIRAEAEQQEIQSLPGTRGDMMDYTMNSLGAEAPYVDGNLAFALHKIRHGG